MKPLKARMIPISWGGPYVYYHIRFNVYWFIENPILDTGFTAIYAIID